MTYQFEYEEATRLGKFHDDNANEIEELAPTMPESVDGGEGAEFILNTVARIGELLAIDMLLQRSAGDRLETAIDINSGADESSTQYFNDIAKMVP
jgi:hypothetical protein